MIRWCCTGKILKPFLSKVYIKIDKTCDIFLKLLIFSTRKLLSKKQRNMFFLKSLLILIICKFITKRDPNFCLKQLPKNPKMLIHLSQINRFYDLHHKKLMKMEKKNIAHVSSRRVMQAKVKFLYLSMYSLPEGYWAGAESQRSMTHDKVK